MRISVFPKGELDDIVVRGALTPGEWIRSMFALPIQGVELYSGMFDPENPDLGEVTEVLEETGLQVPMFCASPDFTHPDAGERAAQFERQARMMAIAREIGGPGVACRVLSGQRHPGVSEKQGIEWATENISALLPLARELDVVLTMENHYKDGYWEYPEFAQHRADFLAIVESMDDHRHFGVQFDPSNATVAGDDPVDFLRRVIGRVKTVQASDRTLVAGATREDLRTADGTAGYADVLQHGVIGDGLNDYPAIFTILAAAGYDGWISIEDGVGGFDDMVRSVDFLVRAREEYFSGSFGASAGIGEDPTGPVGDQPQER